MTDPYNLFLIIVFSLLCLATAVQLFYYLYFYLSVHTFKPQENKNQPPVSIIICARNEAENLGNFLPSVLEQDYPDYEVIVVNDCSEDNSYDILGEFILKYPNLKISTINKDPVFTHNKRFAQFIGIKAAKNEILLLTDADCQPESDKWLAGMASHFDEKTTFVLGYGGYLSEKGLLNKYIRYESMIIAMQYFGMALKGFPYMGVGRNLAYRRSLFFENKGYGAHNHLISGDDDLFVNTHATNENTAVEYRTGTHTRSLPASGIDEWIAQKKRHLTTSPYYKIRDKLFLIAEPLSRVIFYSSFIILLCFLFLWKFVLVLFVLRMAVEITVFYFVRKKLNEPGLLAYSLLFDIFSPLINSIIYTSNLLVKPGKNRWK